MNFSNPSTLYIMVGVLYCSYIVSSMAWDYFYSDQSYECQLDLIAFLSPFALAFGYFGIFLGSALAILILLLASALWPISMFFEIRDAVRKFRIRRRNEEIRRSNAETEKRWAAFDAEAKRARQVRDSSDFVPNENAVRASEQESLTEREVALLYYLDLHNENSAQKGDQAASRDSGH